MCVYVFVCVRACVGMCMCVRVSVCARARVCVCVCVYACRYAYHILRMHVSIFSSYPHHPYVCLQDASLAAAVEGGLPLIPYSRLSEIQSIDGGSFGEIKICKMNGVTLVVLKKNSFNTLDPKSILKDLEFLSRMRHTRVVIILGTHTHTALA